MNYEKLTDWQLNQVMHNLIECQNGYVIDCINSGGVYWKSKETGSEMYFSRNDAIKAVTDYLQWNKLMEIAIKLGVYLTGYGDNSKANRIDDGGFPQDVTLSTTPQRAIVICCIKALEANK